MYPTCHILLLCVSNSENYHLMYWSFKTYRLVYHETCLSSNRSSSPVILSDELRPSSPATRKQQTTSSRTFGRAFFPARTPFSVESPYSFISFELLSSSPPSYTTFPPFLIPFCCVGDGGLVAREDAEKKVEGWSNIAVWRSLVYRWKRRLVWSSEKTSEWCGSRRRWWCGRRRNLRSGGDWLVTLLS